MNKAITALSALLAALIVTSCVVRPAPVRYVETASPLYADEDEYVPPAEYIVDGPVYFDTMPGVTFYPMFIDLPGSCYCVVAVRFYRGVWLGVDNRVIHRGHFAFRPAPPQHRAEWHRHGGVVHGMRPIRGTFEHHGGRLRPMPPSDTRHHQVIMQRPAYRDARSGSARPVEHGQGARSNSDHRPPPAEASRRPGQPDIRDTRENRDGRDARDNRDSRDNREARDARDNRDSRTQMEPPRNEPRAVQSTAPASPPVQQPSQAPSQPMVRDRSRDQPEQSTRIAPPPDSRPPQAESRRDSRPVAVREYRELPPAQPRPVQTSAPAPQAAPQAQGQPAAKERPRDQAKQGSPKRCSDAERNDKKC
jgi:hypothetical protein